MLTAPCFAASYAVVEIQDPHHGQAYITAPGMPGQAVYGNKYKFFSATKKHPIPRRTSLCVRNKAFDIVFNACIIKLKSNTQPQQ